MGAQTWEDVKDDILAGCVGGAVVLLAVIGGLMVAWPELILSCVGL